MNNQKAPFEKNALQDSGITPESLTGNSMSSDIYIPEIMTIRITGKCNLNCYMCSRKYNPDINNNIKYRDIPEEILLKTEPFIKMVNKIIISGGEPTIADNFILKMQRIKQLNPDVKLKTNTNGLLFHNPDFAESMIRLFDYIYMSLHGVDSYSEISGGYPFEKIKRSLENIKDARKKSKKKCYFAIAFVLMRKNIRDIVPAAELAKEMGADEIFYRDLKIYDDSMKYDSARHNPELLSGMLEEVQKASLTGIPVKCDLLNLNSNENKKSTAADFDDEWDVKKSLYDNRGNFRERFKDFSFPCCHPWGNVIVSGSGVITLCCNGNTVIGNLKEKNFEEIWSGTEAENYRNGIITGNYYKDCKRCKFIVKDNPESHEKKYIYNQK